MPPPYSNGKGITGSDAYLNAKALLQRIDPSLQDLLIRQQTNLTTEQVALFMERYGNWLAYGTLDPELDRILSTSSLYRPSIEARHRFAAQFHDQLAQYNGKLLTPGFLGRGLRIIDNGQHEKALLNVLDNTNDNIVFTSNTAVGRNDDDLSSLMRQFQGMIKEVGGHSSQIFARVDAKPNAYLNGARLIRRMGELAGPQHGGMQIDLQSLDGAKNVSIAAIEIAHDMITLLTEPGNPLKLRADAAHRAGRIKLLGYSMAGNTVTDALRAFATIMVDGLHRFSDGRIVTLDNIHEFGNEIHVVSMAAGEVPLSKEMLKVSATRWNFINPDDLVAGPLLTRSGHEFNRHEDDQLRPTPRQGRNGPGLGHDPQNALGERGKGYMVQSAKAELKKAFGPPRVAATRGGNTISRLSPDGDTASQSAHSDIIKMVSATHDVASHDQLPADKPSTPSTLVTGPGLVEHSGPAKPGRST
jgi:hypothetical protein